MNLQHLEYLIEIENCGSISKAARRLFVTQPYLSRFLKEVESEYGITVFTREKTGITPTDSGRLFLDRSASHYLTVEDTVTAGSVLMEVLFQELNALC